MLCMLKHTLFSCVYAKGVFSIHKITTASNCNKHFSCFVLFPGFSSHRTREYIKNNTRLQGRQSPLNTITHPLFQLGDLAHKLPSQWRIQDFWKGVWRVAEGHEYEGVGEGSGVPSRLLKLHILVSCK